MLHLTNTLKMAAFGGFIVFAAIASQPAFAGDRTYCDDDSYHCYRVDRSDGYYDRYRDERYDDRDRYGDHYRGWHRVCDSDGDRCYSTTASYWNYREYYRRHGYHWNH